MSKIKQPTSGRWVCSYNFFYEIFTDKDGDEAVELRREYIGRRWKARRKPTRRMRVLTLAKY